MAQPFIGEIKMSGGNFAPASYAMCNGQILFISQNTALFSLLGTTFGGNGQTTFALPNLQSRAPLGVGQGPGLGLYGLGQQGGTSTVMLGGNELPLHTHTPAALSASPNPAPVLTPAGNVWAVAGARRAVTNLYKTPPAGTTANMNPAAVGAAGGGGPHNNMQPYLAINFIIALQGVFPARN